MQVGPGGPLAFFFYNCSMWIINSPLEGPREGGEPLYLNSYSVITFSNKRVIIVFTNIQ